MLVGNCDSCLFLGGSDATSLEYISKKLGKETIRSVNNSRSYGKQGSYSISHNKTARELMTTDELGVMDNQNCVLFIRGLYPFFCTKYPLEKHPNYSRSGDGNKKYMYDVKERIHTGKMQMPPKREENRAVRLYDHAQRADTREAERQHRQYNRPPETRSARNRELMKPRPMAKDFENLLKQPHERTPEETAQMAETFANLEFMEFNDMSPDQVMAYQVEKASEVYGPPSEFYSNVINIPEYERAEE